MRNRLLPLFLVMLIWAPCAFSEIYTPDQVDKYASDRLEATERSQADDIETIFNNKAIENVQVGIFTHKLYLSNTFSKKAIELFKRRVEAAGWDTYTDTSYKDVTIVTIVRKGTLP